MAHAHAMADLTDAHEVASQNKLRGAGMAQDVSCYRKVADAPVRGPRKCWRVRKRATNAMAVDAPDVMRPYEHSALIVLAAQWVYTPPRPEAASHMPAQMEVVILQVLHRAPGGPRA
jgi:hypothetical protein